MVGVLLASHGQEAADPKGWSNCTCKAISDWQVGRSGGGPANFGRVPKPPNNWRVATGQMGTTTSGQRTRGQWIGPLHHWELELSHMFYSTNILSNGHNMSC